MWKLLFLLAFFSFIYTDEIKQDCSPVTHLIKTPINHPVSTKNPQAQAYFNLGLTYIFAFNHELSFNMFEKASEEDSNLAMAYWGMALALGQNINQDITPENEKRAYEYSQKALSLMSQASPVDQEYIKALAVRYSNDPNRDLIALRYKYYEAMKKLTELYTQDLDAASLYAESILDLDPWKYWTWDGKPKDKIMDAIQALQSVLVRDPEHIGANHYYIHAWEESQTPERALLSAIRLTTIFPYSGHLLHMPCHIFILCGYYNKAIETSKRAIAEDWNYVQQYGVGGYPLHYIPHNYRILARAYMLNEDYESALKTAEELKRFITPYIGTTRHINLARNLIIPIEVNLYFYRWNELINMPAPQTRDPYVLSFYHFARSLAALHTGDKELFQNEKSRMIDFQNKLAPSDEVANNPASKVAELARLLLEAEEGRGSSSYIDKLTQAVDLQDRFEYDEPPAWYIPISLQLGEALLDQQDYAKAESVFKKGLIEYQRNGRLLKGLSKSLKGQHKDWDAFWVEKEIKNGSAGF